MMWHLPETVMILSYAEKEMMYWMQAMETIHLYTMLAMVTII